MDVAPDFKAAPGEYIVSWPFPEAKIVFEAGRIKTHSDGRVQASVKVFAALPGEDAQKLHHETMNLAAGQTRGRLARTLQERLPRGSVNWDQVIEKSCMMILEREEQGSPTVRLQPVASVDVEYLLGNLILDGLPVLSYAPGGNFKSYIALYKAILIENGLPFLGQETKHANTLILDWEVTKAEADRRCTMLANGLAQVFSTDIKLPLYRHCMGPIQDEASEIAKTVAKNDIRFLVIDSAGLACGGDVASAELAIQFFNTLRKVTASTGAATDIQTHTTKADRKEENQRRLPIGSIYWENLSRITWEIRSQREQQGVYRVGLFPRKCNMGDLEPVGLRMMFGRDALVIEEAMASDVSTEQGAIRDMILVELEHGAGGPSDLAKAVGTTPGMVSKLLTDLKARGLVANVSRGKWTLTTTEKETQP